MNDVVLTAVCSAFTALFSWFLTRRKYKAEVDSDRITNLSSELDFYVRLCDDNQRRLDDALKRCEQLERLCDSLELQIKELKSQIAQLN